MKRYEILPHTADVRIKVFGKTKKELFCNALLGMAEVFGADLKEGGAKKRIVNVKSSDPAALLVDFLNEVLYLTQVNKEVYTKVKIIKFSNTDIKAEIFGKKVERFSEDIKAATYHNLKISKTDKGLFETEIIFDI